MPTAETVQELRAQVEDLALQLVLRNEPAGAPDSQARFAAALEQIGHLASQQQCRSTGEAVSALLGVLRDSTDSATLEESLRHGITELQRVIAAELQAEGAGPATEDPPPAALSLAQDPELLSDFIVEAREHLNAIESQSLVLEHDPGDAEAIHAVFRGFHTIKGLAGFLELAGIQEVAHEVETMLDSARNGQLAISPPVIDVVLESADYLSQAVNGVEAGLRGAAAPAPDYRGLLTKIVSVLSGGVAETGQPSPDEAPPLELPPSAEAKTAPHQDAISSTLRVDAQKLDYLMDMVGEMAIAQALLHNQAAVAAAQNSRLQRSLSQLARATTEVQRTAMSMRMVPIRHLFQRMERLVRDLSRKTGKQVNLETSGEETELDKTIAEELADPLMHMIRNALDHGIEDPETRRASGKNPVAGVFLRAYHQSGQIVVEVGDDGRGLDREKILAKAVEKALVEPGAALTPNEIFSLIFEPGFSTAARVTDVSGRGVGMDVVRKHVQKLRGHIDIQSTPGQGTRFLIKLPLTLAMIDGLVVGVGRYRYVVPIFAVREIFRPSPEQTFTVENREEMVLVRGRLLPLIRLHERFGVEPRIREPAEAVVIVAEFEGRQFGLMVDELAGKQEVVIKGLGETLKNVSGVAGGAILGDGRVGLILDMAGVFRGRIA
jgi:two-component system, chemotaxis family, sensor kinase CheA